MPGLVLGTPRWVRLSSHPPGTHSVSEATNRHARIHEFIYSLSTDTCQVFFLWASVSLPTSQASDGNILLPVSPLALSFSALVTRIGSCSQKVTGEEKHGCPEGWVRKPEASFFLLTSQHSSLLGQESTEERSLGAWT